MPGVRDADRSAALELPDREVDAFEQRFDALTRLVPPAPVCESPECISGLVLQGLRKPYECPAFGRRCTPESPLGAPMVSSDGACAASFAHNHQPSTTNH